jgi:hypothetical protein
MDRERERRERLADSEPSEKRGAEWLDFYV